ncbi:protein PTST homolog 2, chloroplastic-like isoform X3 [Solanum stenotomum]|uniref:protein PTST homolog 2, chloroplastic-like isoform X3 n=1 Tax=Solanum stenotomum TaxID=172797 RepID=UPI0020D152E6|nr:protein PTST homolog 2, chloroplastic-like isoform X3 [Solanum stenotomum]
MVSLILTQTHLSFSPIPTLIVINSQTRLHCRRKSAIFNLVLGKNMGSFQVFKKLSKKRVGDSAYCLCRKGLGSEGDMELEEEILAFMEISENPSVFPTRKELEKAGRVDLVEAIKNRGGWFSFGWDSEDDDTNTVNVSVNEVETVEMDFDIEEFHDRVKSCQESDLLHENEAHFSGSEASSSSQPASSSGRSIETVAEEDSGIEGILSRLEKERNSSLGIDLGKHGHTSHTSSRDNIDDRSFGTTDAAAEVALGKSWIEGTSEASGDGAVNITESRFEALQRSKNGNNNEISTRLIHLEFELSISLGSLKSKSEEFSSKEVFGSSPSESDAWEFQQNEFMNGQERLRLIRAKLAVLEGKMTLAMIDAQKMLDEKQKRIDRSSKALQLLRTARIVWTNSASEVLLAGSFDGWTTQRKMEKSSTGVFSVSLKLYPGRYEIKFVVDGIWKIDPLWPIVHNDGHENNLFIVT